MPIDTQTAVKLLQNHGPCDVADGLAKYGDHSGGFIPNLTQFSKNGKVTVGPAYTVTYAPLDDPRPALGKSYIDSVPKGSVVVVGLTLEAQLPYAPYTTISNALYGGLMSTRAKYLGATGTVVFGRIRDVDEHRSLNYNVWAYGTGICAPKSAVKLVAVNEPLEIVIQAYKKQVKEIINSGDIIIGDENGIARIPASDPTLLERLVSYIPKRVKADELVAEDINNGAEAASSQQNRRSNL